MFAREFGGGPSYWLDPDLSDQVVSTATAIMDRMYSK